MVLLGAKQPLGLRDHKVEEAWAVSGLPPLYLVSVLSGPVAFPRPMVSRLQETVPGPWPGLNYCL